ncbi:NAD(P)-dependent oxidoreductase [Streptomyces sp. PSKA54]|uniref:NAD(P)-dependent oxidoreductase n=1 Tax=Streptomyces himalayensis subsp. aureolus TaxID=2758039 RepID=A0A7W2D8F2_9ACTN|nr:NAD(P)-dependent oxidoreductase [Streptomyces himalayensis]MBA4866546.1 NAD(P)-dependent oxidoreductase [Streptomyces himalayensis subsp. aureolus]
MTRVGFIGLGSQGAPMARRITEESFPLTLWARRRASTDAFADTAATVAAAPAELGAASDIVCLCVVADADVEDVLLRPDGVLAGMAPGGVVAIHSTIHPDTCRHIADEAAKREVAVVDAPVSGGGGAATERRLLVMAGGQEPDVARCRPVFETFADPVIHLGPLGTGQLAKVLNNLVFTAQVGLSLDTFSFADGLGMDRAAVAQVLAHGSGGSRAAAILAASGFNTAGLRQALPLLRKDVGIMLDVADTAETPRPQTLADLAAHTLSALDEPLAP